MPSNHRTCVCVGVWLSVCACVCRCVRVCCCHCVLTTHKLHLAKQISGKWQVGSASEGGHCVAAKCKLQSLQRTCNLHQQQTEREGEREVRCLCHSQLNNSIFMLLINAHAASKLPLRLAAAATAEVATSDVATSFTLCTTPTLALSLTRSAFH